MISDDGSPVSEVSAHADNTSTDAAPAVEAQAHAGKFERFPTVRAKAVIIGFGFVLILLGATIYFSMPANNADFRLHAKTSFFAFRVAGDHTMTIESSDWTALGTQVDSAGDATEQLSRSPHDAPPGSPPDRISISLQAGDVVEIRADDMTPLRYDIHLPTRAATLSVQSGNGASLYRRRPDGKRIAIDNSSPTFQFRAGQGPEGMGFTLAECQAALNPPSTGDRADSTSIGLPLATCGRDIVQRLRVDRIGFGAQTRDGVAAGLLDGGLQFLDHPNSEIPLYHGTDLRLDVDDVEISALELARDGIGVYASGSTRSATFDVETRERGTKPHSIMPTRLDALRSSPLITTSVAVMSGLLVTIGFVISIAGFIRPFGEWIQRMLGVKQDSTGSHK